VFSGVLHTDLQALREAIEKSGFREQHSARRGDWMMLSVNKI